MVLTCEACDREEDECHISVDSMLGALVRCFTRSGPMDTASAIP